MSELYRDTGVVLRTYKLRESDRIVVFHTAENGKVRAVAKGVRKTKSKFGARLEPMSHVKLLLYRGRELDIVSQAEAVEPLSPMLSSLDRASQGLAVLEAVDQLSLEREPNPQLYRMLVGVLRTIAERPSSLNVAAFYWKLLANEGMRPELDSCIRCGESRTRRRPGGVRPQRGRRAVSHVPVGAGDQPRCTACCCATSSAAGSSSALAEESSPATHEVSSLATKALEFHIERRLKTVAMFESH